MWAAALPTLGIADAVAPVIVPIARSFVMKRAPDPMENQLLAALPDPEWQRWLPQLEPAGPGPV